MHQHREPAATGTPVMRALFIFFPLPMYLMAGVVLGLALWPALLLVKRVYTATAGFSEALQLFFVALATGVGYFVFGISLLAALVLAKRVTMASSPLGTYPMLSPRLANWVMINGLLMMAGFFFLQFTRITRINVLFYKLLGMKVGRNVIIDSIHVYDVDLIELGHGSVIAGDAVLMAHLFERGSVYYAPIRVGPGAEVGFGTVVMPGVEIGRNAVVGAHSLVLKNTVIPPNTMWAGVPAQQVRSFADRAPPRGGDEGDLDKMLDAPPPELLREVQAYYTSTVSDGKTIFDIWETDGLLGPKMTPASALPDYRAFLGSLVRELLPDDSADILSVGFGNGKVECDLVAAGYNVVGAELFPEAARLGLEKNLLPVIASGHQLPFRSNHFDLILLDGSLGHMPSVREALREIGRVAVQRGVVVISDDTPPAGCEYAINPRVFLIRLSDDRLEIELSKAWPGVRSTYHRFSYERPGVGTVERRIVVAELSPLAADARLS